MRVTSPSPISPTIAEYLENLSPAHVTRRLNFYDDFNRTVEDTDVWTSGGDDGSFTPNWTLGIPSSWRLETGAVIDNDRYLHGDGVTGNKRITIDEDGVTTVTWEARLKLSRTTNLSAFWGLILLAATDYAEPVCHSLLFLVDPAISATFRARTYAAAEEETDTLVALDTGWHRFKMVWTAASVLFYIDDVLVATHAAQVPAATMVSEFIVRTEGAATGSMDLDLVQAEVS